MNRDKVILISGGTTGIGRAILFKLLKEGAFVCTFSRSKERVNQLKSELINDYIERSLVEIADVRSKTDLRSFVEKCMSKFGKIDAVINNAGVCYLFECDSFDSDKVREMFDINIIGTMNLVKATAPHFKEKRSGMYINVLSISSLDAVATGEFYSATKFAMRGYSLGLRDELSPFNIKVSNIYPGPTDTGMFRTPDMKKYIEDHPGINFLQPEDVAETVSKIILKNESDDVKI